MKRTGGPRDLDVDVANHELFEKLKDYERSPFYGRTMKDIFIFAMSLGYAEGTRKRLSKRKGSIPRATLTDDDEWLIRIIAIAEDKALEVLFDETKVFQIAEEYANGGIRLLANMVMEAGPGDPAKNLESKLLKIRVES